MLYNTEGVKMDAVQWSLQRLYCTAGVDVLMDVLVMRYKVPCGHGAWTGGGARGEGQQQVVRPGRATAAAVVQHATCTARRPWQGRGLVVLGGVVVKRGVGRCDGEGRGGWVRDGDVWGAVGDVGEERAQGRWR